MNTYEDKIKREKNWYLHSNFSQRHFLNSRLFFSPERNDYNYLFPKKRLSLFIEETIKANDLINPYVLIAPIGSGDDVQYIRHLSKRIIGIDISQKAIDEISEDTVETYVGDMKNMTMFSDNQFDIVLVPLFFHHFVKHGFDDFLKETYRVLKPGGLFFSLEPSSFHPVSWLTWCGKKVFGNITGQVDDEMAFNPKMLSNAIKRCGFHDVQVLGASFSHNRVPIWIAKIINVVLLPMLKHPLFKYYAWMCLFYGRK